MANLIPAAIADFETQLSAAISAGDTSLTLASATDDDGNSLPAGMYCFTVNNGSSNKQYLLGQLNGTAVTGVKWISRQGVETSGAQYAARAGSPVIISDFATIQRVADILRGLLELDGASPLVYDAEPTLADRKEIATVGYVLDTVTGGTVTFDQQVISGNAGETFSAGALVYFKTSDQEWYKTDADTAATVEGVQLGIALGAGSDGVAITGGIQISGTWTTTGLTAGSLYYASNTAGAIASSAGTTKQVIGIALSTTKLLILTKTPISLNPLEKDFVTNMYNGDSSVQPQIVKFTSSGTWTKDAGLKYVIVEGVGGGGSGGELSNADGNAGSGGGAGGYFRKVILASNLGATETVTVGTGGTDPGVAAGNAGTATSFGSHATANGGSGGSASRDAYGGAGGTATGGDVNITGGNGYHSMSDANQSSAATAMSGEGGCSYFGGEPAYGSGSRGAGGAGQDGIVIVTEYYS